jgi:CRISPR/Cas system-associated exonuclease Cas4 (RecB family)
MILHPTTQIVDSSKLSDFLECPRKYFYSHVLGWRVDQPAHALYFGTCWHAALEALWTAGFNNPVAYELACAVFLDEYRKEFDELSDEIYYPKTPSNAFEALEDYMRVFKRDAEDWEVLFSEISITVPILNGYILHGRMDQLAQHRETGQKKVREYKTTGRFDRQWRDQWLLSTQIGTYTHALYSLYPVEEIYGVVVEGAIFQKKGIQIQPIPCRKTPEQMLSWLQSTSLWYDALQKNMLWLQTIEQAKAEEQDVLPVFPMNPQSCTKYFGCQFHDFCSSWANPLQHADEPPVGYKVDFWDPNERPAKKVITIT